MLSALLQDLRHFRELQVTTLIDARLSTRPFPADVVEPSDSIAAESRLFDRLSRESDMTLLIAPECDGILASRLARCEDYGISMANVPSHTARIFGDKLRSAAILDELGIKTPATAQFDGQTANAGGDTGAKTPVVVKPLDGAGSEQTWRIDAQSPVDDGLNAIADARKAGTVFVQQPWVTGSARSVAFVVQEAVQHVAILCQCLQDIRVSPNGSITYLGGSLTPEPLPDSIISAINRLTQDLPCTGYLSIDFVIPEDGSSPVIIELNPRLTTSYLGYRQAYGPELALRLVGVSGPIRLRSQQPEFSFTKQQLETDLP